MSLSRSVKYALGAVAVVAAVLVVRSIIGARDAEWQARVERETIRAEAALANSTAHLNQAAALQDRADSLEAQAAIRDTVVVRMIERLPAPPPDCEPFTLPRDSVIIAQQERNREVSDALQAQREANALLRQAEAESRMAADSLLSVLADRPRPLSPLIPTVGLGCAIGVAMELRPGMACGLTFSWEVNLF